MKPKLIIVSIISFSVAFLLWPMTQGHYTFKSPCPYASSVCDFKRVRTSWRLGGGFDIACTLIISNDPFAKRQVFTLKAISPCIDRTETYDGNKGYNYLDEGFNVLIAASGSAVIGIAITAAYYVYSKSKAHQ